MPDDARQVPDDGVEPPPDTTEALAEMTQDPNEPTEVGSHRVRTRMYVQGDRALCLAVFDTNVPRYFRSGERGELESFLDDLPGPYLVLETAPGAIVGCGGYALADGGRRADLCWGMIRSEHHGQGLGRYLTRERLLRALRSPEIEEVALSTSQHTVGFYEGLGFRVVSVVCDGYGTGLDRCDMRLAVAREGREATLRQWTDGGSADRR